MTAPSGPTQPLRFNKTIVNLPGVLTPDSIFAVRKGAGIDLYVSDMTGSIAYKSNSPVSVDLLNSNTITSITSLSFNPDSGFSVTDLGNGHALVSVAGSGTSGATGSQGIQGNVGATGSQGIQGIQGIQGTLGIQTPYRQYDELSVPLTYYKGWSTNANTSAATWKILKGVEVSTGNYAETWADGDESLDNIWDDRLTKNYV